MAVHAAEAWSYPADHGGRASAAQALDDDDKPLAPRFTVPTAEPQAVPLGCYRFRFTAPGRCSETYRTLVGTNAQGNITLDERRLWAPIELQHDETAEVVDFGGHADLILAGPAGIRRLDGRDGKPLWEQKFDDRADPHIAEIGQFTSADHRQILWSGTPQSPVIQLLPGTPDLDGDGVPDLLWSSSVVTEPFPQNEPAWILALSGKTGKVLWFFSVRRTFWGLSLLAGGIACDSQQHGRAHRVGNLPAHRGLQDHGRAGAMSKSDLGRGHSSQNRQVTLAFAARAMGRSQYKVRGQDHLWRACTITEATTTSRCLGRGASCDARSKGRQTRRQDPIVTPRPYRHSTVHRGQRSRRAGC